MLGHPIRMYWWQHASGAFTNFGDELNRHLIERVFGRTIAYAPIGQCELIGIGSILELALDARLGEPCHVWGSGFLQDGAATVPENWTVHAVRGHLSAGRLASKPVQALGDPGLLCCHLLPREAVTKRYAVGIIPHFVDRELPSVTQLLQQLPHAVLIDVRRPVLEILEQVQQCEFIFSSSLHGLVTADSLGIPNQWIEPSGRVLGGGYKFRDYMSVFGQEAAPLSDLAAIDSSLVAALASRYCRDELPALKEALIRAFPWR